MDDSDEYSSEEEVEREVPRSMAARFRISNAVNPSKIKMYTVTQLYDMQKRQRGDAAPKINTNPPYQRDVVWAEKRQVKVIDSLMRNLPVGMLTFHVRKRPSDGFKEYVVMDGKQRLTSIKLFVDGSIPHKDAETKTSWYFTQSNRTRKTHNILPEAVIQAFLNMPIQVEEYHDLAEKDELEVFQRLQGGMALTIAERLQALAGAWPYLAHKIEEEYFDETDGLQTLFPIGSKRKETFRRVVDVMYFLYRLFMKDKPRFGSTHLEDFLKLPHDPEPEYVESLRRTMDKFVYLAKRPRYSTCFNDVPNYPKTKKVAPIEFVMIAVLLDTYEDMLPDSEMVEAISGMREDVRVEFDGAVRGNTDVYSRLKRYITEQVIKRVRSGRSPAMSVSPSPSPPEPVPTTATSRKRKADQVPDGEAQGGEPSTKKKGKQREAPPAEPVSAPSPPSRPSSSAQSRPVARQIPSSRAAGSNAGLVGPPAERAVPVTRPVTAAPAPSSVVPNSEAPNRGSVASASLPNPSMAPRSHPLVSEPLQPQGPRAEIQGTSEQISQQIQLLERRRWELQQLQQRGRERLQEDIKPPIGLQSQSIAGQSGDRGVPHPQQRPLFMDTLEAAQYNRGITPNLRMGRPQGPLAEQ